MQSRRQCRYIFKILGEGRTVNLEFYNQWNYLSKWKKKRERGKQTNKHVICHKNRRQRDGWIETQGKGAQSYKWFRKRPLWRGDIRKVLREAVMRISEWKGIQAERTAIAKALGRSGLGVFKRKKKASVVISRGRGG